MNVSTYREEQPEKQDQRRQLRLFDEPRETWTGRVVYDRKLHAFNTKDILRIVQKTKDFWQEESTGPDEYALVINRIRVIRDECATWLYIKFGIITLEVDQNINPAIKWIEEIGEEVATFLGGFFFSKIPGLDKTVAYEGARYLYRFLYDIANKLL
jgi:hypothetical protein